MRRIFAFLALLSGILIAGAPANAAVMNEACQQVASADAAQSGKQVKCDCRSEKRGTPGKKSSDRGCKARKPVIIYIPTVQLGIDRAYE